MSKKTKKQLDKIRRDLIKAIDAAMEAHDELIPDHDKYEPYLEDMVASTDGFTVDVQKFRDFHNVLYFALAATFGVDGSDGKSQPNVYFHLTDRERYPSEWHIDIPYTHKIPDNDGQAWAEVLRLAGIKARSAVEEHTRIADIIGRHAAAQGAVRARRKRAKDCSNEACNAGLIHASYEECRDWKKDRPEFHRIHMNDERTLPMCRILCGSCQTKERDDEVKAEEAEERAGW